MQAVKARWQLRGLGDAALIGHFFAFWNRVARKQDRESRTSIGDEQSEEFRIVYGLWTEANTHLLPMAEQLHQGILQKSTGRIRL